MERSDDIGSTTICLVNTFLRFFAYTLSGIGIPCLVNIETAYLTTDESAIEDFFQPPPQRSDSLEVLPDVTEDPVTTTEPASRTTECRIPERKVCSAF